MVKVRCWVKSRGMVGDSVRVAVRASNGLG